MERTQIRDRTKASLNRIKAEIAEKGSYTTRGGKTIKKLGTPPVAAAEAAKKGRAHQIKLADERAEDLWPLISNLLDQGHGYRAIARATK